ncbi:MAG TPA: hypothetical protein P5119_10100 [Candidatus Aminicenantes bacterium]|nr:hypothetical protein [Candidatus Aminicenantes bacterium]HRY65675.1 hypothetical protein [Candidatus Aminicenantes bacterium]HRZ72437.1 hypothetical protein [Candidatus Aminicenantes bacterium]
MAIDLSRPEQEFLVALLQEELDEVRSEFHHTQAFDYKETLKEREALVRGLLAKLKA